MTVSLLLHRSLIAPLLGMLLLVSYANASPFPADTPDLPERILYIGHLNFDCIEDTVIGVAGENRLYLPHAIAWGRLEGAPCPGQPVMTHEEMQHRAAMVPRTRILYPAWRNLHCSVAFHEVNGDTLPDIMLFLRGEAPPGTGEKDRARVLVLFGQKWLDTVAVVRIEQVKPFQYEGFFAMDLQYGRDIVEPEIRDISGVRSHVLLPVALRVLPDSIRTPKGPGAAEQTLDVRIHPNPAAESARLEGRSLPPGEYTVEIIAVNGEVRWRQDVVIATSGELLRLLDLRDLASGYYLLRLHRSGRSSATYPIIITR